MIEKMHFVNIAGSIKMIDTFIIQNIVPYEIELVNAENILGTVKGLRHFNERNPYQNLVEKVRLLGEVAGVKLEYDESVPVSIMPTYLIEPEIDGYERQIETISHISKSLRENLVYKTQLRNQIIPIKNLEIEVDKLFDFDYMKFRFGSMPIDSFEKLSQYVEAMDVIVYEVSREENDVYLVYFTPRSHQANIDSLFASIYFKRIRISDDIKGYPKEALSQLNLEIDELTKRIEELEEQSRNYIKTHMHRIQELYTFVVQLDSVFDVRKLALRSQEAFYITCWIPDSQLQSFIEKLDELPKTTYVIEEDSAIKKAKPPTRLKNNKFFAPFENIVKMYGVPSYHEFDPTIFVAITYMLLFGAMFGDVGQGIVISLVGLTLFKKFKLALGQIMIYIGVMSSLFGFVYGSVFGNEELLRKILPYTPISPMDSTLELLGVTIGIGVVLIIIVMAINIKNAYSKKDIGKMLFDRNGIAGLVFYLAGLGAIGSTVMGIKVNILYIIIFIVIPLIVIFLSHPLGNLIVGNGHIFPEDKGGFFIETIFEIIETLIAFLSNTISFMRVGAFALNHVGFFLAFHMMSEIAEESSGTVAGIIIMIIGNIVILVLEGLVVGIQALRLEYYELFSRFFEGEGSEFKPFRIKKIENDM